MKLGGRKIALLVEDLYEDTELWYPYYRMKEEGADVVIVGPETAAYKSKYGYPALADMAADAVSADEFDAVIIPGGYAPDRMRRHKAMVKLVKDAIGSGRVVAAICHGGWMLASADVIRNRTVTGFFAIRDDLIHAGADYVDEEVVVDGGIITSRRPSDLPAFCRAVISALE